MASVNKVILIGTVDGQPATRSLRDGVVCTLRLKTTETWHDKRNGSKNARSEIHCVVLYRQLADIAQRYLVQDSEVYIEGRIRYRSWQDDQGNSRNITEIEASSMTMLGRKSEVTKPKAAPVTPNKPMPMMSAVPVNQGRDPWEDAPNEDPFPW